jgi:dihydroxyacetone kinase-like protein
MKGQELASLLTVAMGNLQGAREELRSLDAAIGDGDLGITVADGAKAAVEGLSELRPSCAPTDVLRTVAQRFASANPSTMAALVASGLLAAAKALAGVEDLNRDAALTLAQAAAEAIARRGGAELGDKTILDALLPSLRALQEAPPDALETLASMVKAAQGGASATASLQGKRGRSAWVGERGIGHADGGAVAYLRFLEALKAAWPR